jgi:hypothetical protein
MSKRLLVMIVTFGLLAAAGALVYINSTPKTTAAAADCAEKPKPKDEFAMAAECDAPAGQPATPAAATTGGR